ncbi:MAG: flagellar assembly peptidoglycan hydrolase FlgJ [Pigmentiphaga sp.]|uniref:flagellar assembly peptidoglycan hydrolase FlgJ n=1 Tax=Pigmentiphaga sp. TaxID=1977564 RepID=UPI0029A76422|nr:flagellar assembly peptidoglycan hydrolase FlgJ [Pigmentiphaga sp.]MDX3904106.1 flagellar assembly peptidoglycan hydrolase FlgJ [Pigmentiphaga sp.]
MSKLDTAAMAGGLAIDARSLDALKQQARRDQAATVRQATRQFEAQFAQMLLSQMRRSSLAGDGTLAQALNSPASQTWRGMLDQQLAQTLAGVAPPGSRGGAPERSGLGLADLLERQLSRRTVTPESLRQTGLPLSMSTLALAAGRPAGTPTTATSGMIGGGSAVPVAAGAAPARRIQNGKFGAGAGYSVSGPPAGAAVRAVERSPSASPEEVRAEFLGRFLPAARRAEAATGIPAAYILGQAALESGWGRHEIRGPRGERSHNLFGIKATGWDGRTVQTRTTEYRNGIRERVTAEFRAYDSYEHAFEDYARLLASNPRYAKVLRSTASAEQFAQGLQRAGYATDPRYAEKLGSTIRRAMQIVI